MTAGEEWAAAELRRLRAERFTPDAWVGFITRSFDRAASDRSARPALTRQARHWSAFGAAAGLAASTLQQQPRRGTAGFAAWWAAVALMLDWHLGMVEGLAGEPRRKLSPADAFTLTRLWSVPFLAVAERPDRFTALIAAAAVSDTLDGPLARAVGPTRLGHELDKTADLAIMLAAASSARRAGWLSGPVARLLLLRGTLPIAVVAGSYFLHDAAPPGDQFGSFRRHAPTLITGLAIAPTGPRVGNALVALAAAGPLAAAAARVSRRGALAAWPRSPCLGSGARGASPRRAAARAPSRP